MTLMLTASLVVLLVLFIYSSLTVSRLSEGESQRLFTHAAQKERVAVPVRMRNASE